MPPSMVVAVMPWMGDRVKLVVAFAALIWQAWVLTGPYALQVSISSREKVESEEGCIWWYNITVKVGRQEWTVKRRHRQFWRLYMKLLQYGVHKPLFGSCLSDKAAEMRREMLQA